ncbi:short-chain dehydrogenase TIC 32 A, chloroplastic-like isoform X2 [Typha latifolia]|uniref:short-chain dehydrogenase TIC 32 A, chloroplastic-like isoform X2 n=1 Tax=Typha latifolia TaxID=4733 RepID=UPI003C2D49B3
MGVDREAIKMVFSMEFWRMAILWTLSLLYSHFHLLFAKPLSALFPSFQPSPSYPRCHLSTDPDSKATSGLGKAAAKALAREGYHVVLAGRCPDKLNKTIEEIKQKQEDAHVDAFEVDLSSIHSVMNFGSSIKQWLSDSNLHPSIQLLINNAGILAKSCRITADRFDQMMQTNYIGAFFLTNILLPLLKSSPVPSRVVNVTSFTHRFASCEDFSVETLGKENLSCSSTLKGYPFASTYGYSKRMYALRKLRVETNLLVLSNYLLSIVFLFSIPVCLLLFSYELHRQLYVNNTSSAVSVMPADPGIVKTDIMRELPPTLSRLAFTVLRFLHLLQWPEIGVRPIIDAALAPPDASGKYFFGGQGRTIESSSLSYNTKLAEELWSVSSTLFREAQFSVVGSGSKSSLIY